MDNGEPRKPTTRECEYSQVVTFLQELKGDTFTPSELESQLKGFHPLAYGKHVTDSEFIRKSAGLVNALEYMEDSGIHDHSLELQMWWRDYKSAVHSQGDEKSKTYIDISNIHCEDIDLESYSCEKMEGTQYIVRHKATGKTIFIRFVPYDGWGIGGGLFWGTLEDAIIGACKHINQYQLPDELRFSPKLERRRKELNLRVEDVLVLNTAAYIAPLKFSDRLRVTKAFNLNEAQQKEFEVFVISPRTNEEITDWLVGFGKLGN